MSNSERVPSVVATPSMHRRQSRVRFDDNDPSSTRRVSEAPVTALNPEIEPPLAVPPQASVAANYRDGSSSGHVPLYSNSNSRSQTGDVDGDLGQLGDRRESEQSDTTLHGDQTQDPYNKYSFSSYQHPCDIPAPPDAYSSPATNPAVQHSSLRPTMRPSVSFAEEPDMFQHHDIYDRLEEGLDATRTHDSRRGVLSNLLDLHAVNRSKKCPTPSRRTSDTNSASSWGYSTDDGSSMRRSGSMMSSSSQILDPDDPRLTGVRKQYLEGAEERRRKAYRTMDYKARRKEKTRLRIEFNITSVLNRQLFLLKLGRALVTFGAPSHRIEAQLVSAARVLEVEAEFIHLPNVIIYSFNDENTQSSETHFVKCGSRLALGSLHEVHQIYRAVVHDEISAKKATMRLNDLLMAKPIYSNLFRCVLAFFLSVLICPLAFGGSFIDMWIAGIGAFILCMLQLGVASKSAMYANVFEISIAIFMSFLARALSSVRSQIFCYTAISSAGIIGILPGFLILSSSLALASKNIICGSVKMVYALIYTLFLGFGLQVGSDLYFLFDPKARHTLQTMAATLSKTVTVLGSFVADNATLANATATDTNGVISGIYTFTDSAWSEKHIIQGCFRAHNRPWYLHPLPFWTQFLIVPLFSVLSSLANLQPWKDWQLLVMVVISCAAYTANKIANHYIFDRSDIVSAIGAFTVGILGNIYSRKFGGTAFTSMVTGVLFLVPSGLSQEGGITAQGSGIDIGGAMIAVTIGITVGLFMSQAFVYMFGDRKKAAIFSF